MHRISTSQQGFPKVGKCLADPGLGLGFRSSNAIRTAKFHRTEASYREPGVGPIVVSKFLQIWGFLLSVIGATLKTFL